MKIYLIDTALLEKMEEEKLVQLIDLERKQRLEKIKRKEDRFRSIGAGLLLRYVYMQKYHVHEGWERVQIYKNSYGKPSVKGKEDFFFSLTHSGSYAGICVDDCECGIDIQEMKPFKMRLAERFFDASEYEMLRNEQDYERQRELFYRIWTAKESFVKYQGTGLADGIDSFVLKWEEGCIQDKKSLDYGYIDFVSLNKQYMLCVCSKNRTQITRDEMITLSVPQLLEGCYAKCNWEECS